MFFFTQVVEKVVAIDFWLSVEIWESDKAIFILIGNPMVNKQFSIIFDLDISP